MRGVCAAVLPAIKTLWTTDAGAQVVEKILDIVTEWDPVALTIDQKSPAAVVKPLLITAPASCRS